MKTLLIEAQLKSHARVKDGSMNITFHTAKEIETEELTLIDKYWKQNGWMAFKIDEINTDDIPDTNTDVPGAKSPSVRLRYALFAKHMAVGGAKETFPTYYNRAIEGFIVAVTDSY